MVSVNITKTLHGSKGKMELNCDFEISKGDFLAVFGPSGSGKTTLLRVIAGLEKSKGEIVVDKKVWQNDKIFLKPQKREIGFVFQDFALFPNMTVLENLLYVNNDKKFALKLLKMGEILELKDRFPLMLSGGQKQRVALIRAIMRKPKLLLMDEPFSALDVSMREKLQNEIYMFHKEFGLTTIMVSHSPGEIYKLANKVLEIDHGKIINFGDVSKILLKTNTSEKFSIEGTILDIIKTDVIYIAVVEIASRIVEIVLSQKEALNFKAGDKIIISTKAFHPNIKLKEKV